MACIETGLVPARQWQTSEIVITELTTVPATFMHHSVGLLVDSGTMWEDSGEGKPAGTNRFVAGTNSRHQGKLICCSTLFRATGVGSIGPAPSTQPPHDPSSRADEPAPPFLPSRKVPRRKPAVGIVALFASRSCPAPDARYNEYRRHNPRASVNNGDTRSTSPRPASVTLTVRVVRMRSGTPNCASSRVVSSQDSSCRVISEEFAGDFPNAVNPQ